MLLGVLFGTADFANALKKVVRFGMPPEIALSIMAMHLPETTSDCLPVAVLIATLLVLQRQSRDMEIIALVTSGVGFLRLMYPSVLVGLLVVPISFALIEFGIPDAQKAIKNLTYVGMHKCDPLSKDLNEAVKLSEKKGAKKILILGGQAKGSFKNLVMLDTTPDDGVTNITVANQGAWSDGRWLMKNGTIYKMGDSIIAGRFDQLTVSWDQNVTDWYDNEQKIVQPTEMSTPQLQKYMESLNPIPPELLVLLHRRFARPFACLMIVFAAGHFGLTERRSASWLGLVQGAVVLCLYFCTQSAAVGLGENGRLNPMLAAWLPNIIIFSIGTIFVWRKARVT